MVIFYPKKRGNFHDFLDTVSLEYLTFRKNVYNNKNINNIFLLPNCLRGKFQTLILCYILAEGGNERNLETQGLINEIKS